MSLLQTTIWLPPGSLSLPVVRQVLSQCIDQWGWVKPVFYGSWDWDETIASTRSWLEQVMSHYAESHELLVASEKNGDVLQIHPDQPGEQSYIGSVDWYVDVRHTGNATWASKHRDQVAELMRMLRSPLAYAALEEDSKRKCFHEVEQDVGSSLETTIDDYSQGLPGLFWRNFFGPQFSGMFGDRLEALPDGSASSVGDGYWLVQAYPLPQEADTPGGKATEKELIEILGVQCFYDHKRRQRPTRHPKSPPR